VKTITGNFVLPSGCPVANGVLFASLSADAVVTTSPLGMCAPKLLQYTLNANGSLPANSLILANDELTPSGTQYTLSCSLAGGGRVWGPEIYSLTGSSPINLNNFTPTAAGGPAYPAPVLQTPAAAQTINAFSLSITSGLAVTKGITTDSETASGLIGAATLSSSGNVAAASLVSGATLSSSGAIVAAGQSSGATLSSSGAIVAAGQSSGATLSSSGNVVAAGTLDGAALSVTNNGLVGATLTVGGVAIHGAAAAGNVLAANSSSDATWQTLASFKAVQTFVAVTMGSNVTVASNVLTSVQAATVTMPAAGSFRAHVGWQNYAHNNFGANITADFYVTDGTNKWASAQKQISDAVYDGCEGSGWSPGTYAAGATVTFTQYIQASNSGSLDAAPLLAGPNAGMQVAVMASN
jgi:hypothetical protein